MDYIPGLDTRDNVSTTKDKILTQHINNLVDNELSKLDTSILHPSMSSLRIFSTGENDSILPRSNEGIKPFMSTNLSSKYTSSSSSIQDLKLLASHSQLRFMRNNTINQLTSTENNPLNNLIALESSSLDLQKSNLQSQLSKKRKSLEQISNQRKKQIKDFKPINDFLYNRWNEKINELIQLQIQLEK
ncbi:hypothetical protein C6P40_004147 [Pichia californica]|uniref:Uncharacterized protein n=1 Tax=Pichia californica TaxID=460514 RepID=A0A9P7BHV8_9ASCO|nr:hypothetical protein C6P42_003918 [[Candida] californica]KAG0689973.1 hypothetical protein C6P40_004147 [[Candida] californica]